MTAALYGHLAVEAARVEAAHRRRQAAALGSYPSQEERVQEVAGMLRAATRAGRLHLTDGRVRLWGRTWVGVVGLNFTEAGEVLALVEAMPGLVEAEVSGSTPGGRGWLVLAQFETASVRRAS